MDILAHLATGFGAALTPVNLGFCLIGVLLGTAIGVLPGIGPIATIAMLLPITYGAPPLGALIMLAGIYYGAQYGGSTTAILVNLPGEILLGGHLHRRLPDGQARPRRRGALHRRRGLAGGRLRRHAGARRLRPGAGGRGRPVRVAGILAP